MAPVRFHLEFLKNGEYREKEIIKEGCLHVWKVNDSSCHIDKIRTNVLKKMQIH